MLNPQQLFGEAAAENTYNSGPWNTYRFNDDQRSAEFGSESVEARNAGNYTANTATTAASGASSA